ncbi:type 4a pilus biogenesis protein PilO [bacterium]|nr:type 4a pilus biogenesis protein PilO [bacterium]MBU1990930.1 type 4a pilus biogenesis protein PilO [bacterium]
MKINTEDYLHRIDAAFKDKSQKDIYMTYIMIFALIFAFAYLLFWESSLEDFNQKRAQISALESKISADKMYLQYNPEAKIAKLINEIKKAESELLVQKDNNAYIKSKIETISSLIYDERSWGEYLHSISKNAQLYNIKITNLSNKYALTNNSFGHILDISIQCSGSYKNTLKFINSLEQSDLVVDIHDLSIKAQDNLDTSLKISVWGITY